MEKLLADSGRILLLGNEAIARGLIEAGCGVAATYPGTPSSEIGGVLDDIADKVGMYFEYSVNEIVAMEVAAAAAVSGVRSFAFMKHVGLNVASDAFMTLSYVGVRAGMVILTADDPSIHSSQSEQDNRYYAKFGLVPMLEPTTPAECKEMIIEAFELSEKLHSPVLVRTTTRVNHARGAVTLNKPRKMVNKGVFVKDPAHLVTVPANARRDRLDQLERIEKAQKLSDISPLNYVIGHGADGIITSGVSYTYAAEYIEDAEILKLGFSYPLPEEKVKKFLQSKQRVVVIEELEPVIEDEVRRIAQQNGIKTEIIGKRSGHLPRAYEYSPDTLKALAGLLKVKPEPATLAGSIKLPSRPPVLCAGCPHRSTFYATKKAVGKEGAIYCTDIGCYTLGVQPPMNCADITLCMGSSIGTAGGFAEATEQKAVAFIGDSTFFHGGIPGLINAGYNKHNNLVLIILDNRTTAMTGHQPNPGTGREYGGIESPPLKIEPLVRACGIEFVKTVDPYDLSAMEKAVKEALAFDGPAVIVSEHACPLLRKKEGKLEKKLYEVDREKCIGCKICLSKFSCPALSVEDEKPLIDKTSCIGCGGCAQVCPQKAIEVKQ